MSPVNSYKIDKITYFELKSQTTVFPEKAFFVTYESTQAIRALSLSSKIFQMSLCEPELILTSYTALKITGGFKAEPDLPIGYVGLRSLRQVNPSRSNGASSKLWYA